MWLSTWFLCCRGFHNRACSNAITACSSWGLVRIFLIWRWGPVRSTAVVRLCFSMANTNRGSNANMVFTGSNSNATNVFAISEVPNNRASIAHARASTRAANRRAGGGVGRSQKHHGRNGRWLMVVETKWGLDGWEGRVRGDYIRQNSIKRLGHSNAVGSTSALSGA